MLGRAAAPLLRPRFYSPAIRIALGRPQPRYYANHRPKIPGDYKLPASAAIPKWQQSGHNQRSAPPSSKSDQRFSADPESAAPEYDDTQPEFETDPIAQENIPAMSQELRSRSIENDLASSASEIGDLPRPPQDQVQPEFEGPNDGERNTTAGNERPSMSEQESESEVQASQTQEPQQPLPDLTQGIPSTLDAELREAQSKQRADSASLNITEDPAEPKPAGGGRGEGGLPKSAYISSNEQKKNNIFKYTYISLAVGSVAYFLYLGRNWESEEEAHKHQDAPSGWGLRLFWERVKARLGSTLDYYNEPAFKTLLPKHDPNIQPPMCLVLSLEDLLIHQEWTRERGWRIAKRPGVDYFLRYLSQYYELVLFTTQPSSMADQVIRKLDPYRIIQWPLFREATLYKDGGYIKDLSYLNRDLSKVMLVDTDPVHARNQPENAIIIPRWTGDPLDQTLVQLIPFLEYVATMGFDDTRAVLKSFDGKFIPAEFARREKLLREKFEAKMKEEGKKKPRRTVGGLGSLFGGGRQPSSDGLGPASEYEQGKMVWDQIRERGQKQYELIDKQIREEGQKWLDDMAAEEKKFQEEQMKNMKSGFFGWFPRPGNEEGQK